MNHYKTIDRLADNISMLLSHNQIEEAYSSINGKWDGVCAAMHLVSDTNIAINDFDLANYNYLTLFGLFQAMFVQQDSISELFRLTTGQEPSVNQVTDIRKIRNDAFGHPSNRKNGQSRHLINYTKSYEAKILHILCWNNNKPDSSYEVKLNEIIPAQLNFVIIHLEAVIKILKTYGDT